MFVIGRVRMVCGMYIPSMIDWLVCSRHLFGWVALDDISLEVYLVIFTGVISCLFRVIEVECHYVLV